MKIHPLIHQPIMQEGNRQDTFTCKSNCDFMTYHHNRTQSIGTTFSIGFIWSGQCIFRCNSSFHSVDVTMVRHGAPMLESGLSEKSEAS